MPGVPGKHFLRNLFSGRTLLIQLVKRDFAKRFVGSAGGWLWGIIHPLVMLLSWTFVFQICMKQEPPPGEVTNNYTVFLFSGFLPWLLFQETVTRSATTLLENSNLITKTVFPSEILPVSIFLSSLLSHLLSLILALAAILSGLAAISPMALLLACIHASAGNVRNRDRLDRFEPPGLSSRYRASVECRDDVMVLGHADLHQRTAYSRKLRFLVRLNPLALCRESISRAIALLSYA